MFVIYSRRIKCYEIFAMRRAVRERRFQVRGGRKLRSANQNVVLVGKCKGRTLYHQRALTPSADTCQRL